MYLLIIAVILSVLKVMEVAPVASWSWWPILGVYAATAVWWQVADATGYSKRKSMEKEANIKAKRVERHRQNLQKKGGSPRR